MIKLVFLKGTRREFWFYAFRVGFVLRYFLFVYLEFVKGGRSQSRVVGILWFFRLWILRLFFGVFVFFGSSFIRYGQIIFLRYLVWLQFRRLCSAWVTVYTVEYTSQDVRSSERVRMVLKDEVVFRQVLYFWLQVVFLLVLLGAGCLVWARRRRNSLKFGMVIFWVVTFRKVFVWRSLVRLCRIGLTVQDLEAIYTAFVKFWFSISRKKLCRVRFGEKTIIIRVVFCFSFCTMIIRRWRSQGVTVWLGCGMGSIFWKAMQMSWLVRCLLSSWLLSRSQSSLFISTMIQFQRKCIISCIMVFMW